MKKRLIQGVIFYTAMLSIIFLAGCTNKITEDNGQVLLPIEEQPIVEPEAETAINESIIEEHLEPLSEDSIEMPKVEDAKKAEKSCEEQPIFTSDITDLPKIDFIVPPINKIGTDYKTHAFLKIKSGEIPVYAPIDSVFDSGTYYLEDNRGQYILTFNVKNSCSQVQFRFDHLNKVVDKLKKHLPSMPQQDTRTSQTGAVIEFEAGELVGYTIGTDLGKTWDFGVYDYDETNPFNNKEDPYYDSPVKEHGSCPFKYFAGREKYKALFRDIDGSSYNNELDLCKGL